ncbi:SDR family NAD(P)-dependent oxidoreductase [Govanella unica]|uniref:SDR family oxidoreductase n=1 Tax=Govanella unica TaxID=2975056 RepID=A0A9X3TUS0_9PROT|nr:SDR family NAD(P)-dependent oxidoreductase [Govania unica]MDA5192530.1 SDR family oxidoreductase [Govania unica]
MMDFANKVIVITGGASGIGRAAALSFAHGGATVIVVDLNLDGARETISRCGGGEAHRLNVADEAAWEELCADILTRHGRFDGLINCAGIGRAGNFEELSLADWTAMLDVNLTGVFLGCKHAVRTMRKAGNGGSIVNVSSIAGLVGGDDIAGYCGSKGGVTTLSKAVALHCTRYKTGIRCNSVHPTYVDSEMLDPVAALFESRQAMLDGMAEAVPIGRVAVPQDIANAILFLSSDAASMITGIALPVDGGQLAGIPSKHTT